MTEQQPSKAPAVLSLARKILGALTDSRLIRGPVGSVLDWGRRMGLWQQGHGPDLRGPRR